MSCDNPDTPDVLDDERHEVALENERLKAAIRRVIPLLESAGRIRAVAELKELLKP